MRSLDRRGALIAAAAVLVLVLVGIAVYKKLGGGPTGPVSVNQQVPDEAVLDQSIPVSKTKLALPVGVGVPEAGAEVASNVAVPSIVQPSVPGSNSNYRVFDITLSGGKFLPDTVIVKAGDIAHITVRSTDGNYDFTQPDYGIALALPSGKQKILEGQYNNPGKFIFYCAACGGPEDGPIGAIIVVP